MKCCKGAEPYTSIVIAQDLCSKKAISITNKNR